MTEPVPQWLYDLIDLVPTFREDNRNTPDKCRHCDCGEYVCGAIVMLSPDGVDYLCRYCRTSVPTRHDGRCGRC